MSNWNPLEERLRSWTPRAPSPSVETRLFGEALEPASATPGPARVQPAAWHWLAPAMAVFLLGLFIVERNPISLDDSAPTWAVSAMGQPQLAAYATATHHSDANSPPVTTIESTLRWTNDGYSPKAPAPAGQTNSLIP